MTQMRYARQLAMSERQAITFRYDDLTKEITIIDHNNIRTDPTSGNAVLTPAGYPNTAGSTVVSTYSLAQGGLNSAEMIIRHSALVLPTTADGALRCGVSMTTLISNKLNITFQRDGSVIDSTGTASDRNPQDMDCSSTTTKRLAATASAISVLGRIGQGKDLEVQQCEHSMLNSRSHSTRHDKSIAGRWFLIVGDGGGDAHLDHRLSWAWLRQSVTRSWPATEDAALPMRRCLLFPYLNRWKPYGTPANYPLMRSPIPRLRAAPLRDSLMHLQTFRPVSTVPGADGIFGTADDLIGRTDWYAPMTSDPPGAPGRIASDTRLQRFRPILISRKLR